MKKIITNISSISQKKRAALKKDIILYLTKPYQYIKVIAEKHNIRLVELNNYIDGRAFSIIGDKKRCTNCIVYRTFDNFKKERKGLCPRCTTCYNLIKRNTYRINKAKRKSFFQEYHRKKSEIYRIKHYWKHNTITKVKRRTKSILCNQFRILSKKDLTN